LFFLLYLCACFKVRHKDNTFKPYSAARHQKPRRGGTKGKHVSLLWEGWTEAGRCCWAGFLSSLTVERLAYIHSSLQSEVPVMFVSGFKFSLHFDLLPLWGILEHFLVPKKLMFNKSRKDNSVDRRQELLSSIITRIAVAAVSLYVDKRLKSRLSTFLFLLCLFFYFWALHLCVGAPMGDIFTI
jgi:hypothetical protein